MFVRQESTRARETKVPLPSCCLDFAKAALASLILSFRVNTPHPKELLQLPLVQSGSRSNQRLILHHPQTPRLPRHMRGQKGLARRCTGALKNWEGWMENCSAAVPVLPGHWGAKQPSEGPCFALITPAPSEHTQMGDGWRQTDRQKPLLQPWFSFHGLTDISISLGHLPEVKHDMNLHRAGV